MNDDVLEFCFARVAYKQGYTKTDTSQNTKISFTVFQPHNDHGNVIMIKRLITKYSFLFVFSISTLSLHAYKNTIDEYEIDSLSFDDLNFIDEKKQPEREFSQRVSATRAPVSLLTNLVTLGNAYDTDLTKLYINTAPARSRHASYLPYAPPRHTSKIMLDFLIHFQMHSQMVHPFTERINFDFISPEGEEFILDLLKTSVNEEASTLFNEGLDLFKEMTVQERRGIFGFFFEIPFNRLFLRTEFFIVGIERNYWLNEKLQKKGLDFFKKVETVTEAFTLGTGPGLLPSTQDVKQRLEEISYKFGFGDPRIQLGYSIIDTKYLQTALGVQCLPPLSALFEKSVKIPENEELSTLGEIDRINRINRNPILGSNGHWGLGGFFEVKVPLLEGAIDIFTKMSFDKILAKDVVRDVPIDGQVFPRLLVVESLPGDITHLLCGVQGHHEGWHVSLGYDFYKQEKEALSFARNNEGTENANLSKAMQPKCTHHSLFSSIDYHWSKENVEWIACGLSGSVSLDETGISPHWHVGAKLRLLL